MSIIRTPASRRTFLTGAGTALSAGSIALLGGMSGITASRAFAADMSGDASILNVALGLEHEAIAAYQVGAESGLLQKPVLDVAVLFQTHHKGHRDALIATITKMGGTPVEAKSNADYAMDLDAASLKDQTGVLKLAQRLEKGAANAYIGAISFFEDKALAQVSARLAADESMHWAILTNALGEMLPAEALTFGAWKKFGASERRFRKPRSQPRSGTFARLFRDRPMLKPLLIAALLITAVPALAEDAADPGTGGDAAKGQQLWDPRRHRLPLARSEPRRPKAPRCLWPHGRDRRGLHLFARRERLAWFGMKRASIPGSPILRPSFPAPAWPSASPPPKTAPTSSPI